MAKKASIFSIALVSLIGFAQSVFADDEDGRCEEVSDSIPQSQDPIDFIDQLRNFQNLNPDVVQSYCLSDGTNCEFDRESGESIHSEVEEEEVVFAEGLAERISALPSQNGQAVELEKISIRPAREGFDEVGFVYGFDRNSDRLYRWNTINNEVEVVETQSLEVAGVSISAADEGLRFMEDGQGIVIGEEGEGHGFYQDIDELFETQSFSLGMLDTPGVQDLYNQATQNYGDLISNPDRLKDLLVLDLDGNDPLGFLLLDRDRKTGSTKAYRPSNPLRLPDAKTYAGNNSSDRVAPDRKSMTRTDAEGITTRFDLQPVRPPYQASARSYNQATLDQLFGTTDSITASTNSGPKSGLGSTENFQKSAALYLDSNGSEYSQIGDGISHLDRNYQDSINDFDQFVDTQTDSNQIVAQASDEKNLSGDEDEIKSDPVTDARLVAMAMKLINTPVADSEPTEQVDYVFDNNSSEDYDSDEILIDVDHKQDFEVTAASSNSTVTQEQRPESNEEDSTAAPHPSFVAVVEPKLTKPSKKRSRAKR
jgi:hypothetical protein